MDDRIDRSATSPLLLFAKLTSRPDGNEPIIKAFYPTDYDEQQLHTIKKYAFPFDQQKEIFQKFLNGVQNGKISWKIFENDKGILNIIATRSFYVYNNSRKWKI